MVNTREAESTKTSSDRALVLVNKLEEWLAGQGEGFKVGHHPSGLLIADFIKLGDPDDSYQRRLLTRTGSAAAKYTNAVDGFARPIVDGRRVAMMPRVILYSLIEDYDRNQLPNRGLSFEIGRASCRERV